MMFLYGGNRWCADFFLVRERCASLIFSLLWNDIVPKLKQMFAVEGAGGGHKAY